jgi:hypothetical protein
MDRLPRPTTGQPMERLFDSNFRGGLEALWALTIDSVKNLLNAGPIGHQTEGGF